MKTRFIMNEGLRGLAFGSQLWASFRLGVFATLLALASTGTAQPVIHQEIEWIRPDLLSRAVGVTIRTKLAPRDAPGPLLLKLETSGNLVDWRWERTFVSHSEVQGELTAEAFWVRALDDGEDPRFFRIGHLSVDEFNASYPAEERTIDWLLDYQGVVPVHTLASPDEFVSGEKTVGELMSRDRFLAQRRVWTLGSGGGRGFAAGLFDGSVWVKFGHRWDDFQTADWWAIVVRGVGELQMDNIRSQGGSTGTEETFSLRAEGSGLQFDLATDLLGRLTRASIVGPTNLRRSLIAEPEVNLMLVDIRPATTDHTGMRITTIRVESDVFEPERFDSPPKIRDFDDIAVWHQHWVEWRAGISAKVLGAADRIPELQAFLEGL